VSQREIRPGPVSGSIRAPPSKSYTHRALVIGAHAGRPFRVRRPLTSEDTNATLEGLQSLGYRVGTRPGVWTIDGSARPKLHGTTTVACGESGSTLRFLAPVAALGGEAVEFTGSGRLGDRPLLGLLSALRHLGATVRRRLRRKAGVFEVTGPIRSGRVTVDSRETSQFLSALLLTLPTLPGQSVVRPRGRVVSAPYVAATLHLLTESGVRWRRGRSGYVIDGPVEYGGSAIEIPGDASSTAYLWAAAAITGGRVRTTGLDPAVPQADLLLLDILESAGAEVERGRAGVQVGGRVTTPFDVDLSGAPDLLPLLAVIASTVRGRSRLRGAEQSASKESDRRAWSYRLVREFGAEARLTPHLLEIQGRGVLRSRRLPSLPDHRLVMSAAIGALAADGPTRVGPAESVRKSFPGFWTALHDLGVATRTRP
jgi:3-phosphoshikimate 1-carboxyvinyltransferase